MRTLACRHYAAMLCHYSLLFADAGRRHCRCCLLLIFFELLLADFLSPYRAVFAMPLRFAAAAIDAAADWLIFAIAASAAILRFRCQLTRRHFDAFAAADAPFRHYAAAELLPLATPLICRHAAVAADASAIIDFYALFFAITLALLFFIMAFAMPRRCFRFSPFSFSAFAIS